jgi:hypothetical protein
MEWKGRAKQNKSHRTSMLQSSNHFPKELWTCSQPCNYAKRRSGCSTQLSHNASNMNVLFFAHLWKQLVAFLSIYTLWFCSTMWPLNFFQILVIAWQNQWNFIFLYNARWQLQMRSKWKGVTAANNRNAGTAVTHKTSRSGTLKPYSKALE